MRRLQSSLSLGYSTGNHDITSMASIHRREEVSLAVADEVLSWRKRQSLRVAVVDESQDATTAVLALLVYVATAYLII